MEKIENKNETIVEIINELKDKYEDYRKTHEKEEIEEWVRQFKDKYEIKNLNIDIYFSKAWGNGPTELAKMNILFKDRSSKLYYNANKRTGGYYIIISDLDKEKVNIRLDFSNTLKEEWYNNEEIGKLIEKEIYVSSFKDLEKHGNQFKYINSNSNSYWVDISNEINNYIDELKQVIDNYPDRMEEYLKEHENLNEKYEEIYNKKINRRQGKLFTKYIWALIYEKKKVEPNIENEITELKEDKENDKKGDRVNNKVYDFMGENEINKIIELLQYKKNIILEGVPGVGKTYIAKKIANKITSNKEENIKMVQFHQSYAYEDFVQGLRPTNKATFEPVDGILKVVCDKAKKEINDNFVIIIDEINRGNISKIFGETFMLIEKDKRITKEQIEANENSKYSVVLPYSDNKDDKFSIPENVYFIGTMNTMDRSIALMDFALRRRFAVYNIEPCFNNSEFEEYIKDINNKNLKNLVEKIKSINNSENLDGIKFGHSYFCGLNNCDNIDKKIDFIINYEIFPQLKEYLLGDNDKIEKLNSFLKVSNTQIFSVDKFLNKINQKDDDQKEEKEDE